MRFASSAKARDSRWPVLTLALGIGANAAIFEVLDAVVLRSLPVRNPEQFVRIQLLEKDKPVNLSYPLYRELAARQKVAEGLLAVSDYPLHAAVLRGRGPARTVNTVLVTGGYFDLLGIGARLGRVFADADDRAAAPPVAVISYSFWEREFGRSPEVLGQTLQINKAVVTIVGAAPREFLGETQGNAPDVWLPMSVAPLAMATDWLNAPKASWLSAMARLKPGVSIAQAQAALAALCSRLAPDAGYRLELAPGNRGIAQLQTRFESPLLVLMALVGTVLLIACCNLANLLLGRATARAHEIGVRLAIGAGRGRIIRQLLTESLLLAALGAAAALVVAGWGASALVTLASEDQGWRLALSYGWRVPAFIAAVAVGATCLFGIAPALAATHVDLNAALRAHTGGLTGGRLTGKLLVVAQVSMALMLVSGAALLTRSLWNLRHQDFGFHGEHVLMAQLPWEFSPRMMARYAALTQPLYDRVNALPGVRSAAFSGFGPMGGDQHTGGVSSSERPAERSDNTRIVHVSPRYFETMGIPIPAGRGIGMEDRATAPKVAVLSETAARVIFGGANPIGRLVTQGNQFDAQNAVEVVGVARDVRFASPAEPFGFLIYVPLTQAPAPITSVILRTAGDPQLAAGNLRAALHAIDPDMALGTIRALSATIDVQLAHERLMASLATCFGLLAMVLTCVGVYGVISYAVERRTREIGIRLALGGTRAQVTGTLMREVGLLVGASVSLGGAGAVVMTRSMRTMLFGFGTNDYGLLLSVGLVLAAVATVAGLVPARRAARLDPMAALRE